MRFDALIIAGVLALIVVSIFFVVPNAAVRLGFSGALLAAGEFWRTATFSFAHVGMGHMLENLLALAVIALLAMEIGLGWIEMIAAMLFATVIVVLADIAFFPSMILAGISAAALAVYGALAFKGSPFVRSAVLLPITAASIAVKYLLDVLSSGFTMTTATDAFFHGLGFIAGVLAMAVCLKSKRRVLT